MFSISAFQRIWQEFEALFNYIVLFTLIQVTNREIPKEYSGSPCILLFSVSSHITNSLSTKVSFLRPEEPPKKASKSLYSPI